MNPKGQEIIPKLLKKDIKVYIIGRHVGFNDHYRPKIAKQLQGKIRFLPDDPRKVLAYPPDPDSNDFVRYRVARVTKVDLDPLMLDYEKEVLEELAKRTRPITGKAAIPFIFQPLNNSDKLGDGGLTSIFYTHNFALTGGQEMTLAIPLTSTTSRCRTGRSFSRRWRRSAELAQESLAVGDNAVRVSDVAVVGLGRLDALAPGGRDCAAEVGSSNWCAAVILSKTGITLQTTASMNGRALAQALVALDNNAITAPQHGRAPFWRRHARCVRSSKWELLVVDLRRRRHGPEAAAARQEPAAPAHRTASTRSGPGRRAGPRAGSPVARGGVRGRANRAPHLGLGR